MSCVLACTSVFSSLHQCPPEGSKEETEKKMKKTNKEKKNMPPSLSISSSLHSFITSSLITHFNHSQTQTQSSHKKPEIHR